MRIPWTRPLFGKRKKVGWRSRLVFWGLFVGLLAGGYYWQPLRYEFFPPQAPAQERVLPESVGLFEPGVRVLLVVGHPDDSEFYIGGTLLHMSRTGAVVRLVCMTDGDKAYYPFGVPEGLTETRREEQRTAAQVWGGDVEFLGFRDGRLPVNTATVMAVVDEIEEFGPDIVMAPDVKYRPRRDHSDHIDAGRNAERALREWGRPVKVMLFNTRAPNCFVDITADWFGKSELLAVHKSQFFDQRLDFIRTMLSQRATREGEKAGFPMAESFRVVEMGGE